MEPRRGGALMTVAKTHALLAGIEAEPMAVLKEWAGATVSLGQQLFAIPLHADDANWARSLLAQCCAQVLDLPPGGDPLRSHAA